MKNFLCGNIFKILDGMFQCKMNVWGMERYRFRYSKSPQESAGECCRDKMVYKAAKVAAYAVSEMGNRLPGISVYWTNKLPIYIYWMFVECFFHSDRLLFITILIDKYFSLNKPLLRYNVYSGGTNLCSVSIYNDNVSSVNSNFLSSLENPQCTVLFDSKHQV